MPTLESLSQQQPGTYGPDNLGLTLKEGPVLVCMSLLLLCSSWQDWN